MSTSAGGVATRRPAGRSFGGLLRALVPIMVIVVAIAWWQRGEPIGPPTADPAPDVAYARRISPVPLPVPGGGPGGVAGDQLPGDRAVREGRSPVTLTVGYLTAGEKYAEAVIGDRPPAVLLRERAAGAREDGAVAVGAARWRRYRTDRGEVVLLTPVGEASVLVTGDAPEADLVALAGTVR